MFKGRFFPLLLILPFFILFILYKALPIVITMIDSVVEIGGRTEFILFDNINLMIKDTLFWKSLINTFFIFIIYIILNFSFIFFVSYLIEGVKNQRIILLILYLPTLVGLFAYAIIFRYVFTYQGTFNDLLYTSFRLRIDWFGKPWNARLMISLATLWGSAGFYTLFYINSLKNISQSYYDVIKINGGNRIDKLLYLQIPFTLPVLKTILFISLVEMIALIEIPMNLTMGSPNQSTITISYYVYIQAIEYGNFSYAAILGFVILLLGILVFVIRKPKGEFIYEVN